MDADVFAEPSAVEAFRSVASTFNATEAVRLSRVQNKDGKFAEVRIDTTHDPITQNNRMSYWLDGPATDKYGEHLFRYILDHQD
jgi:hypothetical protein